jgi:hypothetical protein
MIQGYIMTVSKHVFDDSPLKIDPFSFSCPISENRAVHNFWMNLGVRKYISFLKNVFKKDTNARAAFYNLITSPDPREGPGLHKRNILTQLIKIELDLLFYLSNRSIQNRIWWAVYQRYHHINEFIGNLC